MNNWTESLIWLSCAISALVLSILVRTLARARLESRILHLRQGLPKADEIQGGLSPERKRKLPSVEYLPAILDIVEPKAKAGILQEDAILSALEGRILHRVNWFRELSSISILAALVFTFFKLHQELQGILSKQDLKGPDLAPIVPLVGANWPLIALGLVFYLAGVFYQRIAWYRFEAYQEWLESEIFPYLGVSRSTSNQLSTALSQFTNTAATMNRSLAPLQQLGTALAEFQNGLINELVPAIKEGLQHVSVGLTDTALNKLTASTEGSARVVRALQDHQARMLTVLMAAEKRTGDLASAVEAVARHTELIGSALSKQSPVVDANTSAMRGLGETIRESGGRLGTLSASLESNICVLEGAVSKQTRSIDSLSQSITGLGTIVSDADSTMRELRHLAREAAANMSALDRTVSVFGALLAPITEPLTKTAQALPDFATKVDELQARWQESMLQMSSLADEINSRTIKIEASTAEFTAALVSATSSLRVIDDRVVAVIREGESLRRSASLVSDGSRDLIAAFGDLQALGQKLKNLGHGITGHFAAWQKETKEVFRKAQDASSAIEGSLGRMSPVIGGLEAALAEAVARIRELSEAKKSMWAENSADQSAIPSPADGHAYLPPQDATVAHEGGSRSLPVTGDLKAAGSLGHTAELLLKLGSSPESRVE